jgi:hypothetical protein
MRNLDSKHNYFIKLRDICFKHESVNEQAISEIVSAVARFSTESAWYAYASDAIRWFLQWQLYGVSLSGTKKEIFDIACANFNSWYYPSSDRIENAARQVKILVVTKLFEKQYYLHVP